MQHAHSSLTGAISRLMGQPETGSTGAAAAIGSGFAANVSDAAKAGVLSEFDFIIAVDQSGSMNMPQVVGGSVSRWDYAKETIMGLAAEVCKLDDDGIDLVFFHGSSAEVVSGCNAATVAELFTSRSPSGGTPLNAALVESFALANKSSKNAMIIVLTDGEPQDRESPVKTIINQSNSQQKDEECTVLFIQVGDDAEATKYLTYLDDGLQAAGAKFDIVDVKTVDQVATYKNAATLLIDAIND